ncbi:MAG: hypothetical protein IT373_27295 [Polyangiaceae bacterium]|nr:hypothetical protein [Polyangiaceae bacterium]
MSPQSHVEQLMVAEATPRLLHGEQILALGSVRQRNKAHHSDFRDYEVFLVVATNLRLLLLEGKSADYGRTAGAAPLFGDARPRHYPPARVLEWWYQDLASVQMDSAQLHTLTCIRLTARHPSLGLGDGQVREYYTVNAFEGLPSHPQLHQRFLPWLAQQVTAGAFPLSPARQATVQQHQQAAMAQAASGNQRHAMAVQQQQESAARLHAKLGARSWGGFVGVLVLFGAGVLLLLGGAAAGLSAAGVRSHAAGRVGALESLVELDEQDAAWSKAGEPPPKDCPDKNLKDRRELLHPTFSSEDWARETLCHGCRVFASKPSDGKWQRELKRFEQKGELWFCPPAERYREQLEADKGKLKGVRESAASWTGIAVSAGMALLGLVLFAVGMSVVVRGRRAGSTA